MNSPQLDIIVCPKHSDCVAPISYITELLSNNDPKKFKKISNEFKRLGFTKVKDLANATLQKASSIKLHGDSLTLIFKALKLFSAQLENLYDRARLENQNGNFVQCQKICMILLEQKPTNISVLILIANSFFMREDYVTCIDYLKTAHTINANCCEVNMNLGIAYWKNSDIKNARLYISTACLIKRGCLEYWITYADFLFNINDYRLAKVLYEFILRTKTGLFKIHHKFGKLLACTNNLEGAKRQFKIALGIEPKFQESLNNLADVYFLMNKFDKAIFFYLKSLEINPDNIKIIFNLGMAYFKAINYQKAAEAFKKAIMLDHKNFSALKHLAIVYNHHVEMVNHLVLSVETFKTCLLLEPDNFDVNLHLALINLHNLNNFQEAEIYLKKCIQLNPERKDPYKDLISVYVKFNKYLDASNLSITLGDLYVKEDDQENAQNVYICALHFNPKDALSHWKVGVTFYKQGYLDFALTRFKKAILLKPTFSKPFRDTAIIFEEKGNLSLAKKYYRTAIQLQPEDNADLQQRINQLEDQMVALEINE